MRLIDADLAQRIADTELFVDEAGIVQFVLSHTPTVISGPVVRCWECKHRESRDCPMCHEVYYYDEDDGGDYYVIDKAVDPNGFCSAGERRDDHEP